VFKSAEERETARREREAEEAREEASRAELAREAEEERRREEFLATPYGAAKAAMDAGEAFFEIQLKSAAMPAPPASAASKGATRCRARPARLA
jgi:hypothetical protein